MVFTLCVVSEPRSKKNKIEGSDGTSVIRSEPQKSKSTIVENYKAYSFCATDHIAIWTTSLSGSDQLECKLCELKFFQRIWRPYNISKEDAILFGVRLAVLVISPWRPRGYVINAAFTTAVSEPRRRTQINKRKLRP